MFVNTFCFLRVGWDKKRKKNTQNILYITNCDDLWLFIKNTKLTKREKTLKTISSRFRAKPPRNPSPTGKLKWNALPSALRHLPAGGSNLKRQKTHTPIQNDTHTQTLTVDLMNSPSNIYHQSQSIKKRKPMLANLVPFPQILRRPMSCLDVVRYVWMLKRGGHVPRSILRWKGCPRQRIPTHLGPSV